MATGGRGIVYGDLAGRPASAVEGAK
jgi:hypothetical protein